MLVREPRRGAAGSRRAHDEERAALDWAEIQERMLVPLYAAVYERLEIGPGARLLGLGCGAGLALVLARARGASVTGVDEGPRARLALAAERLGCSVAGEGPSREPVPPPGAPVPCRDDAARGVAAAPEDVATPRLLHGSPAVLRGVDTPPYTVMTAFQPAGAMAGDYETLTARLRAALPFTAHGATVVVAGWGPPERCAASTVLRVATRLADTDASLPFGPGELGAGGGWRPERRDDLEAVAARAGLRLLGSGRVACPFGYAGTAGAVRGLLSTGLFDAAIEATDAAQVDKELREALHPYTRQGGTVWMPNVFRYVVARRD
ncbi:SAM-dependent methyltransferase [Streptomyces sp. NPDC088768]|uniref:SAM-dependent methyltransferase n=1 Tax=Streptomyces sp. NPDC088768 TaxID=3365894 RepID=UPI0037FFC817